MFSSPHMTGLALGEYPEQQAEVENKTPDVSFNLDAGTDCLIESNVMIHDN
jgi:hypothetical protein